ncbi:DUF3943 domain-containing protein [Acidobacteriota bacterium]
MKRIAIIIILATNLFCFSNLFAGEAKELRLYSPYKKKAFLLDNKRHSLSMDFPANTHNIRETDAPKQDRIFYIQNYSQTAKEFTAFFSPEISNLEVMSEKKSPKTALTQGNEKKHFKAAMQIFTLNAVTWAFNKYIMHEKWANISLKSIRTNLQCDFDWDFDTFRTNQFGHPYHGALHYSIARANGLNFLESTLLSAFGSLSWEILLESIRPSSNDVIMNTLGGLTLGELLFRITDLIIDESSVGFERVLRESAATILNAGNVFRIISGDAFKVGNPPEKHYFNFELPFGAFGTNTGKPTFLIAANLEYKDYLKKNRPTPKPYEWFSFNFMLGIQEYRVSDIEISATGILFGKKIKNGLAGLFGVFDYIDTQVSDRISAIGIGPGLVFASDFDSNFYLSSSGDLFLILGGSSPSIDSPNSHFGMKINDPYYFGPGVLGRIKFEFGKRELGSIETGFSQYWVHSIYTSADEFLGGLTLNINYDISKRSQISLGYDYYLRNASLKKQRFSKNKSAFRALYILKF